jgi:hypothetical protein
MTHPETRVQVGLASPVCVDELRLRVDVARGHGTGKRCEASRAAEPGASSLQAMRSA